FLTRKGGGLFHSRRSSVEFGLADIGNLFLPSFRRHLAGVNEVDFQCVRINLADVNNTDEQSGRHITKLTALSQSIPPALGAGNNAITERLLRVVNRRGKGSGWNRFLLIHHRNQPGSRAMLASLADLVRFALAGAVGVVGFAALSRNQESFDQLR